jgi:thiamine biosynthesis lipoprotein
MAVDVAASEGEHPLRRYESRAMASPLRLTISGDVPGAIADRAWMEVRDEFEAAEQAMSRFRESSGLTALNRAALDRRGLVAETRLRRAVVAADRAYRLTAGRFDPRVLGDLQRLGYRGVDLGVAGWGSPGSAGAGPARLVSLEPDGAVRLEAPFDLGGIGKGLALRWAARRIERYLSPGSGALVEAGGDLATVGDGPDDGSWVIGIEDPEGGEEPAVVAIRTGGLATSSVAVNRWIGPDGAPAHHLLDPTTGAPGGEGLLAVTVAGPDPAWAEVRTKQLFLTGARSIGALARSLGLAAWWVRVDGVLEMTPAARAHSLWVAAEDAPRA